MKLVSVNVGQPRTIETPRGSIVTSIFKQAVSGRRKVTPHNVEGDRQSDLTVHGGPLKAVYGYAQNHFELWRNELSEEDIAPGAFGENLTVEDLIESDICIGDLVQIGTTRLRVTQPRMPCFKLALRFNRADMVKRFWKSGRSGVYFSVEQAGDVGSGDNLEVVERHPLGVSVAQVISLYKGESGDAALFQRALVSPLASGWMKGIAERWTQMQ